MLTPKETAKELRISLSLVYALLAARKIRHERHGVGRGKILIPDAALEEYRKTCTQQAASVPPAPKVRRRKFEHLKL